MNRTPRRHEMLRRAAAGDRTLCLTSSPLLDGLVRAGLIASGLSDELTPAGHAKLAEWDAEEPRTIQLSTADWRAIRDYLGAQKFDPAPRADAVHHLFAHLTAQLPPNPTKE